MNWHTPLALFISKDALKKTLGMHYSTGKPWYPLGSVPDPTVGLEQAEYLK